MAPEIKAIVKGLFASDSPGCSLGRVSFWLVFGLTIYFWLCRPVEDFPQSLEQALMFLLAYNLGGKLVNRWGSNHSYSHRDNSNLSDSNYQPSEDAPMGKAYDSLD